MSVSLKNKIDVYEIIYSVFDNTACLSSSSHADECIRQGLPSKSPNAPVTKHLSLNYSLQISIRNGLPT